MMTLRTKGVALALALALVAVTLPASPAAAQKPSCTSDTDYHERGWIALSHPGVTRDVRLSQTLYLRAFDAGLAPSTVGFVDLQSWTNGQDAYVAELPCRTDGTQDYCIERLDPIDDRSGLAGIPILERNDDDYRVAFYGHGPSYDFKGTEDPDAQDNADGCDIDAPTGSEFAVVYLASGTPAGVQADERLYGLYTEHFRFHLEGASV